jgi:hypothetical protein
MTPLASLVTATEPVTLPEAHQLLRTAKKGKLPVVNAQGELTCLISRSDLMKHRDYPHASKDATSNLLVGAAVGTRPNDRERLAALATAGIDVVILDSSQVSGPLSRGARFRVERRARPARLPASVVPHIAIASPLVITGRLDLSARDGEVD